MKPSMGDQLGINAGICLHEKCLVEIFRNPIFHFVSDRERERRRVSLNREL